MEWLGPTITDIAREKAGILRRGGTMITLPQHPEANEILGEVAVELDVRGVSAVPYVPAMGTNGPYSVEVPQILEPREPLNRSRFPRWLGLTSNTTSLSPSQPQNRARYAPRLPHHARCNRRTEFATPAGQGASNASRKHDATNNVGKNSIEWILDVAHNPAGAWALRAGIRSVLEALLMPARAIFSCLRDKPLGEMAQILFPLFDQVIVVPLQNARAASVEDLLAAAAATGTPAVAAESVGEALRIAQNRITNLDRINQHDTAARA